MQQNSRRFNIYALIHKGLRAMMSQALTGVGRADWDDAAESAQTLAEVRSLLDFCAGHLRHENEFIHPAMEARRPGSAGRVAEDHVGHLSAIAALREQAVVLESAAGAARASAAEALYHGLSLFVAENYEHMHHEETHNNAVLWDAYSDAEIHAIHQALVGSLPPDEVMLSMRWMLPHASAAERAQVLGEIRGNAPAPVFEALMGMLRGLLGGRDWSKLHRALGLDEGAALAA